MKGDKKGIVSAFVVDEGMATHTHTDTGTHTDRHTHRHREIHTHTQRNRYTLLFSRYFIAFIILCSYYTCGKKN